MDGEFDQRDGFILMNGALIPWTDARARSHSWPALCLKRV